MSRFLLAIGCLLVPAAQARADKLDPELDKPYRFQVVLHIAGDRQLTRTFQDQVARELRANLRAALGDLAEVEVVRTHPRLARIEDEGLQNGLNGWREISDTKTHFVFVDFDNNQYVIRARQHDGLTGLPSPLVREARISERQLVSRTATLLVDEDFGVVATLTKKASDEAEVTLKGAGIPGQDLGRRVNKRDVFAVSVVTTAKQGFEVPWTLLQVTREPQNGVCECKVLHRFENPLPDGPTIRGYRCLKLATSKAPVRLHFVSEKPGQPLPAGLEVVVSQNGFKGDSADEQLSTEAGGYVQTDKSYENVAFVRVMRGGRATRVRLPIPIVGDRTVDCRMAHDPTAEPFAELEWRRDRWVRQLYERLELLQLLAKDLKNLSDKASYTAAREKAVSGLDELKDEIRNLQDEEGAMREAAKELKLEHKLDLADGDRLVQALKTQQDRLAEHIKQIDGVIKDQADPVRQKVQALLHQAKLLEEEADCEQALAKYDEAFNIGVPISEDVKKHVEKLRQDWAPKDDEHREARAFIYKTWPTATTAKAMDEQIGQAQKALQKCIAVGDRYGPRKLVKDTIPHVNQLAQEQEALRAEGSEDNKAKIKLVHDLSEKLTELLKDATKYLENQPKASK
jgi:hypothetical protein